MYFSIYGAIVVYKYFLLMPGLIFWKYSLQNCPNFPARNADGGTFVNKLRWNCIIWVCYKYFEGYLIVFCERYNFFKLKRHLWLWKLGERNFALK